MKNHGNCSKFVKTFKSESLSNSKKPLEKTQYKNFCTKFFTEVIPCGKICRYWDGDEGEE